MSHWRRIWQARENIPQTCQARYDNDDFHIHGCVDHHGHQVENHVCDCGLLWSEEP